MTAIDSVPFFDSRRAPSPSRAELVEATGLVFDSGNLILGPEVTRFEIGFAEYCGVAHATGVANGTDAIVLLLKALGIGAGDEVIVPAQSASATGMAVLVAGARIVFCDIDPLTNTIDPDHCENLITPATKAILAVHLYGQSADLDRLLAISAKAGIALVEDCAQAHGATWRGRPVGSWGIGGTFSFYPTKNLGALGDGGAIVTNDHQLHERIQKLRQYGWEPRFRSQSFGFNSRLDELQAAFLNLKLPHLEESVRERRALASIYLARLHDSGLGLPANNPEQSFHLFVVRSSDRDAVRGRLAEKGIQTGIHYLWALTDQAAFSDARNYGACDEAARNAREVLSLPLFPGLRCEEVEYVCETLRQVI